MRQAPTKIVGILSTPLRNKLFNVRDLSTCSNDSKICGMVTFKKICTANIGVGLYSPEGKPIHAIPYSAGSKAREAEGEERDKMLAVKVIEAAQTEWASPIVVFQKKDRTLRFSADHRKRIAVNTRESNLLPRMDDCIDLLGVARYVSDLTRITAIGRSGCIKRRKNTSFMSHYCFTNLREFLLAYITPQLH